MAGAGSVKWWHEATLRTLWFIKQGQSGTFIVDQ